jgi:hypothetical protein
VIAPACGIDNPGQLQNMRKVKSDDGRSRRAPMKADDHLLIARHVATEAFLCKLGHSVSFRRL